MFRFALLASLLMACNSPSADTPLATAAASTPKVATSTETPGEVTPETVVASWSGGNITYGELSEGLKTRLTKLKVDYLSEKYDTEKNGLDQMLLDKMLEAEAKKRGLPDATTLLDTEVRKKVSDPSEEEVSALYAQNARRMKGKALEEVRPDIVNELRRRAERDRFMAFVDELKASYGVQINLAPPELPRMEVSVDDDPMKGNKDAKVTVVQFAEFQCPYCGKAKETVDQVMKDYDGKIRLVFRDFPLSFHPRAIPAAVAANCAGEQGKYWEMFDQLMSNQRALEDSDLESYAKASGVKDMGQWKTCLSDPKQLAEVQADAEAGNELGVTGTPAFFINGIMLSGAQPYDEFKSIIDRELAGS